MPEENYYQYADPDAGYVDEDEEDIPEAERELAEDAQWKLIQKNTFTRWANEQIKKEGKSLTDLQYDLADGLRLISLVECLSNTKFKGVNRRPHFRTQKLENVTMTLRFLEEHEALRLVNIDSSDIVDCRLKLILGLIWTLILHYSITLPTWEGEEELPNDGKGGPSPKNRLLSWINAKMPDKPVRNFTTDWNDGTAIGALVDAMNPGLCPDWPQWSPKRALENAREAMDAAEQWLDVPQLIKPEEMINPRVDEKAMMTYLSQFPNAKPVAGAPLRPKANPGRVRAYGPGLEPEGNTVGAPARFTIDTFSAGKGEVEVIVLNPRGQKEPCEVIPNHDKNQTYSCAYRPNQEGEYRVIIKFAGKEIPSSPFKVKVEGASGDPNRVTASGPGVEPTGNQVGRRTFFNIFTEGAGAGNVDCVILDPNGNRDAVKPRLTRQSEDVYLVEYTPKQEGLHSVNVFFAGQPIPASPFGVMVAPIPKQLPPANEAPIKPQPVVKNQFTPPPLKRGPDGKKAYATGRGIQPTGMRVRDPGDFQVHTEDCGPGDGNVDVKVTGPGGTEERCSVKRSGPHLYDCRYTPQRAGPYVVAVNYAGEPIQRSPFPVEVKPYKQSNIRAFGPGLRGGIVGKPALFVVETNGETGALGFSIEGPSEARIDCEDNGDGSANVCYWPTAPGEYAVHIQCDDEDIPKSPYMAQIVPDQGQCYPERARAYGPGLEPGVTVNKPAEFTVDVRDAGGPAPVSVECYDNCGEPVPVQVRDKGDGTFACTYTPKVPKKHTIIVAYGGVNIPKSPFRVYVQEASNPSKVRVYGPGVESATRNQPTHFFVDCSEAGPGDVGVSVTDEVGQDVPIETREQEGPHRAGVFRIDYTPRTAGPYYTVQVYFADKEVPKSPYRVPIKADFDVKKVKVEGLEPVVPVNKPQEFDVITAGLAGKAKPTVTIKAPNGMRVPTTTEETVDGYAVGYTPTIPGPHQVAVEVNGEPIPGSPFLVQATSPMIDEPFERQDKRPQQKSAFEPPPMLEALVDTDAKQNAPDTEAFLDWNADTDASQYVRAYGDGLERGVVNRPAQFTIDSRNAPPAPLGVTVEGPSEARIDCIDNRDGTCDVSYVVSEPGPYQINVLYRDQHVPNSPFTAHIAPDPFAKPAIDVSKVCAYGPGLQPRGVYKESFAKFTVDAKPIDRVSAGLVRATLVNPNRQRIACVVDPQGDGTYKCSYSPLDEGPHQVEITYESVPVPGSPFQVYVSAGCDPSRVRAYGPGLEPGGLTNEPQPFTVDLNGAGQGGLGLSVEGPADANIQCSDNKDGTCAVEYFPTKPGTYDVSVKFNDCHVPGSPFHVPIRDKVDPGKVRCYGPGLEPRGARVGEPATFTADASRAGDAPLQVTFTEDGGARRVRPAHIQPKLGTGLPNMFDVVYQPESAGPCHIDVSYGGQPVPGSPFRQNVLPRAEARRVVVEGEGVKPARGSIPASLHTNFTVDTREAGHGDLEMTVIDPEGHPIPLDVEDHGDGTFDCFYKPEEVGRYQVKILFANEEHPESPYQVYASASGRADHCRILDGNQDIIPLNQEHVITVDKSGAGKGAFSAKVVGPAGRVVETRLEERRDETVVISYTPRQRGDHQVAIKFGGQAIPQGQFCQKAVPIEEMQERQERQVTMESVSRVNTSMSTNFTTMTSGGYKPVDFKLPIGPVFDYVKAQVRTPSGRLEEPYLIDNRDGTITVQYQPSERGEHELLVWYNEKPIPGSPFRFMVDSLPAANTGHITAFGPGLSGGTAGESAHFTIVTRDAGAGGLSLAVEGPSKAEIFCRDNKDGTCSVEYVPLTPGDYHVVIKFLDRHIVGSPFTAHIAMDPRKRSQITVGTTTEVPLKISETDISSLSASVIAPSGYESPCVIKRLSNGNLGISFTPSEIGDHLVHVFRLGTPIPNSPFHIFVGPNEVGNASRVRVHGEGLQRALTMESSQFTVDTRNAGYGCLSLSIEGPSKVEIECQDQHDGTCVVSWRPTEPGTYIVNIRYADEHVPGSPYVVKVLGEGTGMFNGNTMTTSQRITSRLVQGVSADATHIGSQCELSLKIPGAMLSDLSAQVTSPSGHCHACDVLENVTAFDRGSFTVRFVPREIGVHTVSVRHRGQHIPGSPFQFTVGPITDGGAHKVRVSGQGITHGIANTRNEFNLYTREAGSGGLSIAIEGPGKAEIDFEDRKDGSCNVAYRVTEAGEYQCSIKFNNEEIPGSPFRILISDSHGGRGTQESFSSRQRYFSSSQQQNVAVTASGEGLSSGTVGELNHFFVHTHNAGSGALSVTVDGPSKVQLNCQEKEGGYAFTYVPATKGEYLISIKYGGDFDIVGSPFRAHIRPAMGSVSHMRPTSVNQFGDDVFGGEQSHYLVQSVDRRQQQRHSSLSSASNNAHRVLCHGSGLCKAYLGQTNTFQVDASHAANDVLYVGLAGPVRPCDEVHVKHQGNNQYAVSYTVEERGRHMLMIKWGETHVPGSPFVIDVP